MTHRVSALSIVAILPLALASLAAFQAQTPRELFPNTTDQGRAAIEFDDDQLHVVAAYYHSQRHHDSRWLLIEMAVSARQGTRISRETITLITPDGRPVRVASQSAFARDIPRVRSLLLRAETTRHGITGYFRKLRLRNFRLFTLPFQGVAYDVFDVDSWQIAWGDLFFASPTGAWEAGTYSLVVEGTGTLGRCCRSIWSDARSGSLGSCSRRHAHGGEASRASEAEWNTRRLALGVWASRSSRLLGDRRCHDMVGQGGGDDAHRLAVVGNGAHPHSRRRPLDPRGWSRRWHRRGGRGFSWWNRRRGGEVSPVTEPGTSAAAPSWRHRDEPG